jgi:hypothetical protein
MALVALACLLVLGTMRAPQQARASQPIVPTPAR